MEGTTPPGYQEETNRLGGEGSKTLPSLHKWAALRRSSDRQGETIELSLRKLGGLCATLTHQGPRLPSLPCSVPGRLSRHHPPNR